MAQVRFFHRLVHRNCEQVVIIFGMQSSLYLVVAVDAPLRRTFDYRCPADIDRQQLRVGMRVRVPFGRQRAVGVLVAIKPTTDVPAAKLKSALEILDAASSPTFDPVLFDLLVWSADYYRHPLGEVLAAALPVALRKGAPLLAVHEQWRLTDQGAREWQTLPTRSVRLRALAAALSRNADAAELAAASPTWRAGLRDLETRGWVALTAPPLTPLLPSTATRQPGQVLTREQQTALAAILAVRGFRTLLLHGVTGSGKTEVYLQAIEATLAAGRQALVLVPEISLTPQLLARFQARFAAPLAVLHSGLNDGERLTAWRAARSGAAPIVIGTRSAVFAPLQALGIVIVDEEHDQSYKQQEGFRYSARDLAIARAQRHGIPVLLGSATPSLESLARAGKQPADLLELPHRAGNAQPPKVELVDLRKHAQTDGIATPTLQHMQTHLRAGGQVLLYLNRRGFAPALFCPACAWVAPCNRCDARLTVHRHAAKMVCHHCGYEARIPERCASCDAPLKAVGHGTERIEDTVAKLLPGYAIARIDRDNVRRRGELEAALAQIQSGATRILVGTQMLTKGHHFPDVTLVAILNADQGLFGTDFRAAERLAQSIVQVAGRAGRAERAGLVIIQTEYPEHPLLARLLTGGYAAFAQQALREREQAQWPPYSRLALLRAEAPNMQHALDFLRAVRMLAGSRSGVRVLGPVPAPMQRRAGRFRAQLLLQAASPAPLQKLLAQSLPAVEELPQSKRVRWSVDVDPIELF
jgi:primosomal protein N' (replication factor Y) (superfamily II helicase)